jgi:Arc/MetJ-type ribon-helix-helix transcriptional regulator
MTQVKQVQVQLRVARVMIKEVDRWVQEGRFANRSDAIKTVLALYEERERTGRFARMLARRSREARERPDRLVPLDP